MEKVFTVELFKRERGSIRLRTQFPSRNGRDEDPWNLIVSTATGEIIRSFGDSVSSAPAVYGSNYAVSNDGRMIGPIDEKKRLSTIDLAEGTSTEAAFGFTIAWVRENDGSMKLSIRSVPTWEVLAVTELFRGDPAVGSLIAQEGGAKLRWIDGNFQLVGIFRALLNSAKAAGNAFTGSRSGSSISD